MSDRDILFILKQNLQILSDTFDDYLLTLIDASKGYIRQEGIELDMKDISDAYLVVMYSNYLYTKRNSDAGMPRQLRYALNNRIFIQKAGDN